MHSILILIVIFNLVLPPSSALNQIGCLIDENYCEFYEFCLNDSMLGICVSTETSSKSLRSEEEIDMPLMNTPIRIHKYSQELDDSFDDSWQKRNLDTNFDPDLVLMQDAFGLLENLPIKRPTIFNYEEEDPKEQNSHEFEYDYEQQEPSSIEDLLRLIANNQDQVSNTNNDQYDYDEILSLQKRDLSEQDDYENSLDEMLYVSNERQPRLIRWLYLNRYSSVPELDSEPILFNRLKTILKENIMIENFFNNFDENISPQAQNDKKIHNEKSNLANLPTKIKLQQNQISDVKNEPAKEIKMYNEKNMELYSKNGQYDIIDASFIFIELDKKINESQAKKIVNQIAWITSSESDSVTDIKVDDNLLLFKVQPPTDPNKLLKNIVNHQSDIKRATGVKIVSCGMGKQMVQWCCFYCTCCNGLERFWAQTVKNHRYVIEGNHLFNINTRDYSFFILTGVLCAITAAILLALVTIFCYKRKQYLTQKLISDVGYSKSDDAEKLVEQSDKQNSCCSFFSFFKRNSSKPCDLKEPLPRQDYQELCRQRMQNKNMACTTMNESVSQNNMNSPNFKSESSRSSTSSWSEEPLSSFNIDISTGHVILSYMEQHLNDKNRLNKDWEYLSSYAADPNKKEAGTLANNMTKNRYSNILPYDHTRVKLMENNISNKENDDYINANFIIDDDPKNAAYIATQGPLIHTSGDFWQMVWEQKSVVIVSLCRTVEYGSLKCNQYWPSNGYEVFDNFEIHLVSEHVWCEDYLVRNFFLKNLDNNQTRTITQFHFLTWPENATPQSIKSLLDFRSDGIGRTGTYILIDMILNKIQRGTKEIDLAATLEFLRDQRPGMVKNKAQFEFSFAVVIEEIQNMLKALTQ